MEGRKRRNAIAYDQLGYEDGRENGLVHHPIKIYDFPGHSIASSSKSQPPYLGELVVNRLTDK